jgi:peptidoglycan/LPS O-acetylase OafA/YrhL
MAILVWSGLAYSHVPPLVISNQGYYGDEPKKCADALTETLMTIEDLNNVYLILATGKYLDNWGAYGSCVGSVEGGHYWMTTVTGPPKEAESGKANLTFYTGLCAPKDCEEADMQSLNELFLGAADFNNVSEPYISYFAVTEYVEDRQGMPGAGEIATYLILLTCFGMVGVGTIIHLTKICDKSHIKERKNREAEGEDAANYSPISDEGGVDPNDITKEFNKDTAILYRKKPIATPMISFSILRNASKLVTPQKNAQLHPGSVSEQERPLQIFNGLRFYAMLWILWANTYYFTEITVVENIKNKPTFFKNFMFTIFPTAYFAADIFFFMSGFLAIYSMLKLANLGAIVVLKQYLRRIIRLIPVIGIIMLIARFMIPRFLAGPMVQEYETIFRACDSYFWTNLLMINNFYPTAAANQCMPWTWFVSVDFQMFLLVPILAIVTQKSRIAGYASSLFLVALSTILVAILNGVSSHTGANPYLDTKFFNDLYIKPWARAAPYFSGVFMGTLFFFHMKNSEGNRFFESIKARGSVRSALYISGFAMMFTIVFVVFDYTRNYGMNWSVAGQVIYAALSPVIFIAGLTQWILPALLGRAKLIRFLLTGQILTLLGRVTYFAALGHPVLMIGIYTTVGQQIYIEGYKMFSIFVGHTFLIYLLSTSLNLSIELPLRGLESIWHDKFYAQNMVENWIEAKRLAPKDQNRKELGK